MSEVKCSHCGGEKMLLADWYGPDHWICGDCNLLTKHYAPCADLPPSPEVVKELVEALRWYGEQARLARLIHSEGDAGRHAISNDGGKRANAILAKLEGVE